MTGDEDSGRPAPRLSRLALAPVLGLLRFYQKFISPLKPPTCRFQPTCSSYAIEALGRHGPWRGGWLALRRLTRCHPFHPGGWDPVPPPRPREPRPPGGDSGRPAAGGGQDLPGAPAVLDHRDDSAPASPSARPAAPVGPQE